MRLLSLITVTLLTVVSAYAIPTDPISDIKKNKKENVENKKTTISNRNFHSIKKWKMTIEYLNGDIISKTIVVREKSNLSALETAFLEAENHLDTMENVRGYSVSPISTNKYILLAH